MPVGETKTIDDADNFLDRGLKFACWCWLAASGFFLAANGLLLLVSGRGAFRGVFQEGPLSTRDLTATAVALSWFCLGLAIILLRNRQLRAAHGLTIVVTLVVVLLYTNVMRERTIYGDVGDYIKAAHNLANHAPFHQRYLYPPLFATLLAPLLPLGDITVIELCWFANLVSLGLFSVLLSLALTRYGFNPRLAALLVLGFLVVNVPVLRTLSYMQVNLHVANLILLTLLCYPRFPLLSALALALAVHLKTSPIVLVLPFVLIRDWRWIFWFACMAVGLVGVTYVPYGWQPFVDFQTNVHNIYAANAPSFRDSSIDSIFRCSAQFFGQPLDSVTWPILITKALVLIGVLLTMSRAIKNRVFLATNQKSDVVLNGVPVLMMFMLLGSPLVWEHHPVFVALPYLLMLKRLTTPAEWIAYGFAFFLEYHVPTFDFYPWSFGRLLSPLMLLVLMYVTSKRNAAGSLDQFLTWTKQSLGLADGSRPAQQ